MLETMSKSLHVSRKALHKHNKFKVQVDENDEVSCWDIITKNPYQEKLPIGIKLTVVDFLDNHSHTIPNRKHVLQQCLFRGVYVEHTKYVLEMIEVVFFKEFQEINSHVKIAISMFHKLIPWFIIPNTICDTFCCQYHIEFQVHYDMFLEFCKNNWQGGPPPTTVHDFVSSILCKRYPKKLSYKKKCVGGIRCTECGELTLLHMNLT